MADPQALIERYVAGELTRDQWSALSQWLCADESNRQVFLAQVDFYRVVRGVLIEEQRELAKQAEASGSSMFDPETLKVLLEIQAAAEDTPLVRIEKKPKAKAKRAKGELSVSDVISTLSYELWSQARAHCKPLIFTAAAAVLLLALIVINPFASDAPGPEEITDNTPAEPDRVGPVLDTAVATLTAEYAAQWGSASAEGALAPGSQLRAGDRLTLTQGVAEITTADGAVVLLEAPCEVELLNNDNAIRLHAGKLVGICETESSQGFLVRTAALDITDMGTRFGVAIDRDGMTLAEVFDGKVVVSPSASSGLNANDVELARGESRVFDAAGQAADRNLFPAEAFASVPRAGSGVAVLFGDADLAPHTIADSDTAAAPANRVTLYQELRGHRLASDLPLTFASPGQHNAFKATGSSIPAGTVIRTYILWHPGGRTQAVSKGSVTFDGEILGAIGNERDWEAFVDATASDAGQVNKSGQHAALESVPAGSDKPNEQFTLSDDRRTLDFQFRTKGVDALRVIVREPVGDQP